MKREVTPGQHQVLQFIQEAIRDRGQSPTLQEIAKAFKKSTGAVQTSLQALRAKGYIDILPRTSRGIRLTEQTALQEIRVTAVKAALEPALEEGNDLAVLFRVVQENLPAVFRMDSGILWVRDEARRRFLGPTDLGLKPAAGFSDGLPVKMQDRREPLWVLDCERLGEERLTILFGPSTRSFLVIPVTDGDALLGIVALASAKPQKGAEDETIEAAQAVSALLVAPIRRAAAQFRLQEDLKLHRLLLDLVKELASDLDFNSLLRRIFHIVEKLIPTDAMYIAIRRKDGIYEAVFETDLDDSDRRVFFPVARIVAPNSMPVIERIEQHRYLLVNRTAEELAQLDGRIPKGDPWHPVGNPKRRSASMLFVPIWWGKEFRGVLSVHSYRPNSYRHEDAERMLVVGEYIALALRNAQMIERLKK